MSVELEDLQSEPKPGTTSRRGYVERLLAGPGLSLLAMAVVSLATWTGAQAGNIDPFVLQAPFENAWWQLPLSVFAHGGMAHLASNATIVAVTGGIVVLFSSLTRYHLFFVGSGALAGVAQVAATGVLGTPSGVLGASGAALALVGYLLTSNAISSWLLDRASLWIAAVVIVGVALAVTLYTSGARVANVAHLAGVAIGLVAGQYNLLQPR